MAVEPVQSYETAMKIAQRKKEVEEEENRLIRQAAEAKRRGEKEAVAAREKTESELVKISDEASVKADMLRKSQNDAVRTLENQTKDHVEKLSADTAKRIADLDAHAFKQISSQQASAMERIKTTEDRTADPFYRMRSLEANWTETEKGYEIKIKVPEHEKDKFFVTAERNELKLSLARSFQDTLKADDGRKNKTSSHQTIVETLTLPTRVDPSTAQREYKDGHVIYKVGKLV